MIFWVIHLYCSKWRFQWHASSDSTQVEVIARVEKRRNIISLFIINIIASTSIAGCRGEERQRPKECTRRIWSRAQHEINWSLIQGARHELVYCCLQRLAHTLIRSTSLSHRRAVEDEHVLRRKWAWGQPSPSLQLSNLARCSIWLGSINHVKLQDCCGAGATKSM